MATTYHVVVPFGRNEDGDLVPLEPVEAQSGESARRRNATLSATLLNGSWSRWAVPSTTRVDRPGGPWSAGCGPLRTTRPLPQRQDCRSSSHHRLSPRWITRRPCGRTQPSLRPLARRNRMEVDSSRQSIGWSQRWCQRIVPLRRPTKRQATLSRVRRRSIGKPVQFARNWGTRDAAIGLANRYP